MRGTLGFSRFHAFDAGIIPAYAGNTESENRLPPRAGDHPRVCGEHMREMERAGESPGSSPRMRGTRNASACVARSTGIIPAYAGNTQAIGEVWLRYGDHPRVCGEHSPCAVACASCLGSSPRMRGTLRQSSPHSGRTRIIPAYAGNTLAARQACSGRRDHPRVCGEHYPCSVRWNCRSGSSPRMRGTRSRCPSSSVIRRIIPAYAGNTKFVNAVLFSPRDHPRVCGEHASHDKRAPSCWGSSPRMRGTRQQNALADSHDGIIPAYAGNTHPMVR